MGKSLSFERRPERREIQPIGVADGKFQRKRHVQVSRGEVTPGCSENTKDPGWAADHSQEPRGGRQPGRAPGGGRGLDAARFSILKAGWGGNCVNQGREAGESGREGEGWGCVRSLVQKTCLTRAHGNAENTPWRQK